MKTFRIQECYKLLQELHYSIKFSNSNNINAKFYFYALCMDLYLDTQLDCIVEYDECKNIYFKAISIEICTEACLRVIANFRLWNAQKGQRYDLQPRELAIMKEFFSNFVLNFNHLCTGKRILELLCVYLKNFNHFENFEDLNKFIKNHAKTSPILKYLQKSRICPYFDKGT